MASMTPVKARDITIDIMDSCNCCWGWLARRIPPDTQLYLTAQGIAEIFDPSKAPDRLVSLKRAFTHLQDIITEKALAAGKDVDIVIGTLEKDLGLSFDNANPPVLTYALLQRINGAINRVIS